MFFNLLITCGRCYYIYIYCLVAAVLHSCKHVGIHQFLASQCQLRNSCIKYLTQLSFRVQTPIPCNFTSGSTCSLASRLLEKAKHKQSIPRPPQTAQIYYHHTWTNQIFNFSHFYWENKKRKTTWHRITEQFQKGKVPRSSQQSVTCYPFSADLGYAESISLVGNTWQLSNTHSTTCFDSIKLACGFRYFITIGVTIQRLSCNDKL